MKQYRALRAFAHQNSHIDKGAEVMLSDKQAEYLRTGGYIELSEKPAAAPKKAQGKTKADVKSDDGAQPSAGIGDKK